MFVGKKYKKSILAVILALAIAFAPGLLSAPAQAATSLSQLQGRLADLKKQQAAAADKLKKLKADKTQKLAYKDTLAAQMNNVQNQIDVLNEQVSTLNANIKTKSAQISSKQAEISKNVETLKQRVRALYLMGEASSLEIILNAKNVVDFADKVQMLQAITAHDTQLINGLKADIKSIQAEKTDIEANRAKVAAAKTELDAKNSELDELVKETQAAVAEISASETTTNAEKQKLAEEEKKENAAVDKWYQDYYANLRAQEAKRKAEEEKKKQSQGSSSKPSGGSDSGSGSGGYVSKGNFIWPVVGFTWRSTNFGEPDTRGIPHLGIDIAGAGIYRKPILAADSGRVMLAVTDGWGGGYGNCVYIDHGNGYSTRYGHCSEVYVKTGQQVTKGQTIGIVGSTGRSTGPHLHFEIRVYGVAKDPMQWFKRS